MFDFLDRVSHPLPCFRQTLLISSLSESGDPKVTLFLQTNPCKDKVWPFSGLSHEMSSRRLRKLVLRDTGRMAYFSCKATTGACGKPAGLRPTTKHSQDVSLQTPALLLIQALFLPKSAIVPTAHGTASETSLTCVHQPAGSDEACLWIGTCAKVPLDLLRCVAQTLWSGPFHM